MHHVGDPIGDIERGDYPAVLDGDGERPADSVDRFASLRDYRDPSTLVDPGALYAVMERAGFVDGIQAVYAPDGAQAVVTVTQFESSAGAQAVLTAHLDDYCSLAVVTRPRVERNGLLMLRDRGAVRVLFVLDDLEVSVFECGCFGTSDEGRADQVEAWAALVAKQLESPKTSGAT